MSNCHITKDKIQGVWNHHFNNNDFINELQNTYSSFLISNYGPNNGLTLIKNSAGNDFLTASSQTLLQQLNFHHPCFKFINALMNSQVKVYGTNSLYVGILCSGLLWRTLKLENTIPHRIIKEVSQWINSSLLKNLDSEVERISGKIDMGKLDHVLCIVRGILNSKSFYTLSSKENAHIAAKIVEAYLRTIPDNERGSFGRVTISMHEGASSLESRIIDGILYREPDFSIDTLKLKFKKFPKKNLKIIIFTIPLSHDTQEKNMIEFQSKSSLENIFTLHMFQLLRNSLKSRDISIIANQKFIHPALKYDLEKDGFLVFERLGTSTTDTLVDMTGCCPISNLYQVHSIISDDYIGSVSTIEPMIVNGKTFVNILPRKPYESITLVLIGINHHITEFLKESINTSISLLQRMMQDSSAVCGAGCFEVFVAHILREMKGKSITHLASTLDAKCSNISQVFDTFIDIFLHLAIIPTGGKSKKLIDYYIDTSFYHLWEISDDVEDQETKILNGEDSEAEFRLVKAHCACQCLYKTEIPPETCFVSLISFKGADSNSSNSNSGYPRPVQKGFQSLNLSSTKLPFILRETSVLDPLPSKLNALRLAFDGFSELFKIGRCIFDR